jgi:peptidoglycan/LPS O-acetylase OafA/YrhL
MQAVTEFRKSLGSPEMLADFYTRMSVIEGRHVETPIPVRALEEVPPRSKIRRTTAVALAILSTLPIIWLLAGTDKLWQLLAHLSLLHNHPVILITSLSGIMLAAGIGKWVSAKVLFALWGLLIAFAILLSVRGGVWETLAAVSPALVAALIKFLLSEGKRHRQTSK